MNQLEELRQTLVGLRNEVNAGRLYKSLGTQLGELIDTIPVVGATELNLPDDGTEIKGLLMRLNEAIHEGLEPEVSDADLLILLRHIGSPDPAIRDKGVYFLFNDLIQQQLLSNAQMNMVVKFLSRDTVLFNHILEPENDGIYQRSFAVLILSVVVYADRAGYHFLSEEVVDELVNQIATYILLERDTRGFIGVNGWAHTYTHIGNLLDELTERESLTRADKLFLMAVLVERYKQLDGALIFGEPQRIAGYLSHLTNKNRLYADYLLAQLKRWRQQLMVVQSAETQAVWNRIYNRGRLIEAMIVRHDFNESIMKYLSSVIDFLA